MERDFAEKINAESFCFTACATVAEDIRPLLVGECEISDFVAEARP